MRTLFALGLFLLTNVSSGSAPQSIPLRELKDGPSFLVAVQFVKHPDAWMLLDTGASETVLAEWFIKEKQIKAEKVKGKGIDSGVNAFDLLRVEIGEISLGKHKFNLAEALVIPTPEVFRKLEISGILSPQEIFAGSSFSLNFPDKKISINPPQPSGVAVPITTCKGKNKFLLKASINGVDGKFYLDTGAKSAAITKEFSKKLGKITGTQKSRMGVSKSRKVISFDATLKFASTERTIPVEIEPKGTTCSEADGKIGNDVLKYFSIYFNKERSIVVISSP